MKEFEKNLSKHFPDWKEDHFERTQKEHLHVRKACGITYLDERTCLEVTGSDRKKLLHSLLSNEIQKLKEGEGNLHHLLTPKGKFQAEMEVYCLSESFRLSCSNQFRERIQKNIQMRILRSEVKVENRANEFVILGLYGPQAPEILSRVFSEGTLLHHEYQHAFFSFSGQKVHVVREHDTGEVGFHLFCPPNKAEEIWQVFCQEKEVLPFGKRAYLSLQSEAGVPQFGIDFQEENLSLEINLNKAVSNTKGCYLGQEAVALLLSRGHLSKRLVGLQWEGPSLPEKDTELWNLDADPKDHLARPEGKITRSLFSPSLKKNIALAFLKYSFLEKNPEGSRLQWQEPETGAWHEVSWNFLPFYQEHGIHYLAGGPQFERIIAPQKKTPKSPSSNYR